MSRTKAVVLPEVQSPEFLMRVKEALEVLMGTQLHAASGRRAPTLDELESTVAAAVAAHAAETTGVHGL
jgi:hypothetical protein